MDEIEHTGAPDRLTIRARSADFRETLNTRREKSWHKTTVGEVVKEIAARHKLKMALGKDLSDKPVEHIDQTNESDGSFSDAAGAPVRCYCVGEKWQSVIHQAGAG
ncbi:Late control protein D protein [Escherichia coli]|uniref:Late control protein D protein n=1 Tax=Escherichia coli TaxID=562 RepID=A0A377AW61_ECOLX|nr:Late control protein D protein [Escherichia coli]